MSSELRNQLGCVFPPGSRGSTGSTIEESCTSSEESVFGIRELAASIRRNDSPYSALYVGRLVEAN